MPALPAARENGPVDRATAIDQLAAVPLDEFVAERKRLAKELRGAGDREGAAEVAKLAKPTPPAWALNHLAREEPQQVAAWLEAGEVLREASERAGQGGGEALRGAMAAHREATRKLIGELRGSLSEPMVDRVRALLQAATVDPGAAERLRAGRLVEGDDDREGEPAPAKPRARRKAAEPAGGKARKGASGAEEETSKGAGKAAAKRAEAAAEDAEAEAAKRAEDDKAAKRAAAGRAELERRAGAASAEFERVREEAAECEAAAAAADERVDEARRTLTRSESEASAAHSAAEDAQQAVEDAEQEVRALIARLRDAS